MKYRELKGYKYELMAAEHISVELPDISLLNSTINRYIRLRTGRLTTKKHYHWDGSSVPLKKYVPEWLWDFDKFCKTASLFHDALCQLIREGLLNKSYKQYIDALYRDMIIAYVVKLNRDMIAKEENYVAKLNRDTTKTKKEKRIANRGLKKVKRIAKRQLKRAKREANLRFWALRKFGNVGIQKRKNPRGQIKTA